MFSNLAQLNNVKKLTIRNHSFIAGAIQELPGDFIRSDFAPVDVLVLITKVHAHCCLKLSRGYNLITCVSWI